MKAFVLDAYGPPQNGRLADVDPPQVRDGSLLVRVHAAGVNPFDYKIVTGMVKDVIKTTFPYVPGMDGAGEVVDIGSGVDGWRKGDAMLGMFAKGSFAQYAVISATEKRLARKPDGLDFERAAALPEAALTANTMVRAANVSGGQSVFIIGATGGLGSFAVQLAKAEGARVIATATGDDVAYVRQLGAEDAIDYRAGDVAKQVRARYPDGVDVVLDVINAGDSVANDAQMLRRPGTLVSSLYGPGQETFPAGITVRYIEMKAESGDLERLAELASNGSLRVEIARTYDLADAGRALADLQDPAKHTRGKTVIRIA